MLRNKPTLKDETTRLIFEWHELIFDYWWRKRYNIPFGSQAHREANFIDMYIEYQEESLLREAQRKHEIEEDEVENNFIGLNGENSVVKPTSEEIDEDYDNLDLSQFDK